MNLRSIINSVVCNKLTSVTRSRLTHGAFRTISSWRATKIYEYPVNLAAPNTRRIPVLDKNCLPKCLHTWSSKWSTSFKQLVSNYSRILHISEMGLSKTVIPKRTIGSSPVKCSLYQFIEKHHVLLVATLSDRLVWNLTQEIYEVSQNIKTRPSFSHVFILDI